MRVLLIGLILVMTGLTVRTANVAAAEREPGVRPVGVSRGVDVDGDEDDDRVEVQLVVLGVVIGTVFVLGTGAWLLRRKLGLTAYTPPADSGHH